MTAADDDAWTEEDLCDFIEVYHDLAARPTRGWNHPYANCGWHPLDSTGRPVRPSTDGN